MKFSTITASKKHFLLIVTAIFCLWFSTSCSEPEHNPEEQSIIDTVERFFSALETRSTDLAHEVLLHEGVSFSVRSEDGDSQIRSLPHLQMIDSLSSPGEKMRERMREPKILLHKGIAVLWTRYDFHRGEKYSHCGVDAFNLIKTSQGWKISGIIYTIEKEGCNDQ